MRPRAWRRRFSGVAMSFSPLFQFALAIGLGYGALWLMLWGRHHADLAAHKRDFLEHAGVRREAVFLAVVLSIVWCLMAALSPQLEPVAPLRLAGGASGVWLAALTVMMLSVQWWQRRKLWKVR
jgi:hypothetical protein